VWGNKDDDQDQECCLLHVARQRVSTRRALAEAGWGCLTATATATATTMAKWTGGTGSRAAWETPTSRPTNAPVGSCSAANVGIHLLRFFILSPSIPVPGALGALGFGLWALRVRAPTGQHKHVPSTTPNTPNTPNTPVTITTTTSRATTTLGWHEPYTCVLLAPRSTAALLCTG
jgi:hypothetical protein